MNTGEEALTWLKVVSLVLSILTVVINIATVLLIRDTREILRKL